VITPGGSEGIYGRVHYKNLAVGIIPLDEDMNTWIVGQYRYVHDRFTWEIPEGGCPEGTDPLASAKRELLEETGISASRWQMISELETSNAVCDEIAYLYVAKGLSIGEAQPEECEDLQVRKLPFRELYKMTIEGKIKDAMSYAAIMKLGWMLDNNGLDI